jgi:hypothetical protein
MEKMPDFFEADPVSGTRGGDDGRPMVAHVFPISSSRLFQTARDAGGMAMTKADCSGRHMSKLLRADEHPPLKQATQRKSAKVKSNTTQDPLLVDDLFAPPCSCQTAISGDMSTPASPEPAVGTPHHPDPNEKSSAAHAVEQYVLGAKPQTFSEALSLIESSGTTNPRAIRSYRQSLLWIEKKRFGTNSKDRFGSTLPCDPLKLRPILERISPGQNRISLKRWSNLRTDLNSMLRKTGWLPPLPKRPALKTEEWNSLIKTVKNSPAQSMLAGFAAFCEVSNLRPSDILPQHLNQYEIVLRKNGSRLHPKTTISAMRYAWNATKRDHPDLDILTMPRKRHPRQILLNKDAIPSSYFDDLDNYVERLRTPVLFDRAFARRVPNTTIQSRVTLLKVCPSILIGRGWPPEHFTSLRTVVTPEAVKGILEAYHERNCQVSGWTTGARSTAAILTTVARDWGQLSQEDFEETRRVCLSVRPPKNNFPKKARERLRQFDDRNMERRFLMMPSTLWQKAKTHESAGRMKRAAETAKYALGLAILFDKPLRIQNLVALDLNLDFIRDPQGVITGIRIEGDRVTKGAVIIEAALRPETQKMLRAYLKIYRPILLGAESAALFPGAIDGHAAKSSFATQFSKLVERELGLTVNPHLVRSYIGTVILDENPRSIVLAQRMLDHRSPVTTAKFYAMQRGRAVEREFADVLHNRLRRLNK